MESKEEKNPDSRLSEQSLAECEICKSQCLSTQNYCVPCKHVVDFLPRMLEFPKGREYIAQRLQDAGHNTTT